MEYTKEQINDLHYVLDIRLDYEDYWPPVNKRLKNIRKDAFLKGFRKGQVPMGMIKKMYGQAVFYEELNEVLKNSLTDYIEEQEDQLKLLYTPVIQEDNQMLSLKGKESYHFKFDVGLRPESFEMPMDESTVHTHHKIIFSEEALKDLLEKEREYRGDFISVDTIEEEKDSLKLRFTPVTEEEKDATAEVTVEEEEVTEAVEEHAAGTEETEAVEEDNEGVTHLPIDFFTEAFRDQLMGLAKGESISIKPFEDITKEEEEILKHVLRTDTPRSELGDDYQMEVLDIQRKAIPALNDALYKDILDTEEAMTYDEFMKEFKINRENAYAGSSNQLLQAEVMNELYDKVELELPMAFLEKYYERNIKGYQEAKEEDRPEIMENLMKGTRRSLILDTLSRKHDIEIDEYDVIDQAIKDTDLQYSQYGMRLPFEYLEMYAKKRLQEEEGYAGRMEMAVLEEEVFEGVIRENITINVNEVTLEEFEAEVKAFREKHYPQPAEPTPVAEEESTAGTEEVVAEAAGDGIEDATIVE